MKDNNVHRKTYVYNAVIYEKHPVLSVTGWRSAIAP
ncbi:hypothetical protein F4694_002295 [Bacillus niacini]|uniref:Uncharacterized protein n=1 Tax=Neobacillus niacini TaxID=86668 RepID=A0A852T9S0_9BACI|nr:hypothetical protein [Neobacillus niacini]